MAYTSEILKDFAHLPPDMKDLELYTELISIHNAIENLAQAIQDLIQYNIDHP